MTRRTVVAAILALGAATVLTGPVQAVYPAGKFARTDLADIGIARSPVRAVGWKCQYKHIVMRVEVASLQAVGFRNIKFLGTTIFTKDCVQLMRFSACKNLQRYRIGVRFTNGANRTVIAQPTGHCVGIVPKPKVKLKWKSR